MLIYLSIFGISLIYYWRNINIKQGYSKKELALFLFFIALFIGLGDMIGGYDRYIYGETFDTIADETWTGRQYSRIVYLKQGIEWGYLGWQILMSFLTENRYVFILFTTLLIYFLFYRAFTRYIEDYPLCVIIFLAFFYYFSMTYLREVIAVGIAWQGVRYIWTRKPLKFFGIMLLASTFHASILIFAIMYFIPFKKYSKHTVFRFLIICLIIGSTPLPLSLLSIAGMATGKGDYTDQDQGFRIEYVLEVVFIVWILFNNYRSIEKSARTLTFLNMCYALCAVLLMFMRFGQGGRFGWPFFIGLFYMLTKLCNLRNTSKWLRPIVISVCFLLFLRITYSWSTLLYPYKTFLTNGIPSGESIYESYEYNSNYTNDKFCRDVFTINNGHRFFR